MLASQVLLWTDGHTVFYVIISPLASKILSLAELVVHYHGATGTRLSIWHETAGGMEPSPGLPVG